MKTLTILAVMTICMVSGISTIENNAETTTKSTKAQNKIYQHHRPSGGLISFDPEDENIRMDVSLNIPFITVPIEQKVGEHGQIPSLLNVNTKGLGIIGVVTALLSVVPVLLSKERPHTSYRSENNYQWLEMGNTINDMIFGNNYVAPCMQRVVCSIVSVAAHSESPTSTDKIIDGLSSHKWFKNVTNGTMIQEAVNIGRRGGKDCASAYRGCTITPTLLKTMMTELGIV
ncbi:uncharacterized protein LOC117219070 [Megalopta genalis]|uniref:uncharacterized protein LOC117219070 n=1 Tax=Megalopta genalis TaxID=115081 RepID=UPI001442FA92|nr:uncharacterized protein LOC117219070 [Megalopta genalis]XP_033323845.1 uncharacterized protein LOC117219070 [Megalopta genalis]XP_033323846.1 uncharacterized protein LOC117219070 [Megalopta genalis]